MRGSLHSWRCAGGYHSRAGHAQPADTEGWSVRGDVAAAGRGCRHRGSRGSRGRPACLPGAIRGQPVERPWSVQRKLRDFCSEIEKRVAIAASNAVLMQQLRVMKHLSPESISDESECRMLYKIVCAYSSSRYLKSMCILHTAALQCVDCRIAFFLSSLQATIH